MSTSPSSQDRPQPSPRQGARWKDATIAVLAILLVGVSGLAFKDKLASAGSWFRPKPKGDQVAVFNVVMDRKNRAYVDILFDHPLGQGRQGQVLDPAPAKIEPALGGYWKWQDTNALRFQPTSAFPVASEFKITLLPERLLKAGQELAGDRELKVVTDRFLVEGIDLNEEPALTGKGKVIFRGSLKFNYEVKAEELAPRIKLVDPEAPGGKPVAVTLETAYESKVIGFRTEAVQKKKEERKVRLVIGGDLTSAAGNVPLGDDYAHEVPVGSAEKLAVWEVTAEPGEESTVKIRFSSPVSAAVAEKYIHIAPAVAYRPSAERNLLSLTGELKPGGSYTLTIDKGMPATDDAVLQTAYKTAVNLPDLEPAVDFQSQGMFLSAAGSHTVALESVNVSSAKLTIDRVYLNNLFFLFQYGGFFDEDYAWEGAEIPHHLGSRLGEETLPLANQKNRKQRTPVTLDEHIPDFSSSSRGLYRVVVAREGEPKGSQRWLLLTDLGVVAKRGNGEMLVWVSSFRDLAAVAGAKVTLVSEQNQTLASGRTDGDGVWRVKDSAALKPGEREARPYMLTVEKGEDFTFLLFDKMKIDPTGLDVGGAESQPSGYSAFLYGERDIYRPGERVVGMAVVRDQHLAAPPRMPLVLRWRDPQGRERGTQKVTADERGLAELHLDLPAFTLTGGHTLELLAGEETIGQYRFQVEEFVPDRIRVEIAKPTGPVGPGQPLAYTVASSYLFGPPAAGLPVETRVRVVDSTFAPKGFPGFTFRNAERKLDDKEIASQQGTLDPAGRRAFTATVPAGAPVPSALEAVITARVQEQGGRGVSALARLPIHPYPYYLGLRQKGEALGDPGKPVDLEWVAVAPDGKPAASGALRVELYRDRWNTVLKRNDHGGFSYESSRDPQLVDTRALAAGQPRGAFRFAPRQVGSYRAVLTDPDTQASTEVEFYVSGWAYSPWALKNPSRLDLDLDKAEYAPGDTAQVQVRAPFPGKLLLTVERNGILYTSIHMLTGNTAKIPLPVAVDFRPNAYVTATLVRGVKDLEAGSVARSFGAVPIYVDRTANRLGVAIDAPPEVRPGTKIEIVVKVPPGAGAERGRATVTVAAVDEGILQLVDQKTAQPFDFFYRKLALGVASADTFGLLLPEVAPEPAGGGEGAEGLAQHVRTEGIRRVQPVAFWSGPVTVDAAGRARVSFTLPEFQGALRIMAVAVRGERFGSAERLTRVRTPLVLLPTFPRILSFEETLRLPVTVRNDTGRDGSFQVTLQALAGAGTGTGAAQAPVRVEGTKDSPNPQTVPVPAGREKTVYFTVTTAGVAGDVRFALTAAGNGETTHASETVGVRPDLPVASLEDAGAIGKAALELPLPQEARFRPETLRRELRLGSVPLVQFAGKLSNLVHYPYGCLEQTVSAAFPLLYMADLAQKLDPDLLDPKKGKGDPAAYVHTAISRVASMQLYGGGFSLWPGEENVNPWATVYAAHFLVEARRAGQPVPDFLHDGALTYLAGDVKAKSDYGSDELERIVYQLYVLARAGRADLGTMDFVREKQQKNLTTESRALLAAAYAAVGNPQAIAELLAQLGPLPGSAQEMERQTGGNWNSGVRNRAIVLLALLDAAPQSREIPALAERLARDARTYGEWTTQEAGWALLALGQLFHRQAQAPPYAGTVFVGDRRVGAFTNATANFLDLRGSGPVRIVMDAGYRPGAAFYSLITRGVPTDDAFAPSHNGLEIEREVLDRDGKEVDLNAVHQGDLLVLKTRVRSTAGAVQNVVIEDLLPSGLEVENPRLKTTESLPWVTDATADLSYLDLRDDRILIFANLPESTWVTLYALTRAVAPGSFRLPPAHAEAMYDPRLQATGERRRIEVGVR
jgi:uncharacterized protein YfaS (alpha-2-macroglobulin family)